MKTLQVAARQGVPVYWVDAQDGTGRAKLEGCNFQGLPQRVTTGPLTVDYQYDAAGNRTSLTEGDTRYGYAYDAENRLTRATDGQGKSTTFGYDALGQRAWVQRPNGVRTTYAYDGAGQVLNLLHARAGMPLASFAYEYGPDGNRLAKTLVDGTREVYSYDSGDRLTSVSYGTARHVSYTLSAIGNRTAMTETTYPAGTAVSRTTAYTYNSFNQLASLSTAGLGTTFSYDNNGNLLTEMESFQTKHYRWDADHRLRQVTMTDGAVHTYAYDASGLRVEQVTPTAENRYLLDGQAVAVEVDGSGMTMVRYLTHPQRIDEVLSFEKSGAVWYPLVDILGSVYAVADSMGHLVRSYSYDVYGERKSSGGGVELMFGYTGREHDGSGLRYHRDRYSSEDRWNIREAFAGDPFAVGGGLGGDLVRKPFAQNRFYYAYANPTHLVDPTGRYVVNIPGAAIGAGVGAVVGAYLGACDDMATAGAIIGAVMGALLGAGLGRVINLRLILKILPAFVSVNEFELNLVSKLGRIFGIGWAAGKQPFHWNYGMTGHVFGVVAYVLTAVAVAMVLGAIVLMIMELRLRMAEEAAGD